ncbi:MAG: hypothetical protein NC254_10160 [bacterium]|nr:hypothetical protein [bacterium]
MTKKCDYCGKKFDIEDARDDFEIETLKNYDYLTKCLCAECAIEAINNMESGIYYEVCENCGSRFDPFVDEIELQEQTGDYGVQLNMFERFLCLACALDEYMNETDEDFENEDEFGEDEDDGERLSLYDAALIWASNGKDEDYTFGYSENELEDALR